MDKYKSRNIISNLHVVSMLKTKLLSFIARLNPPPQGFRTTAVFAIVIDGTSANCFLFVATSWVPIFTAEIVLEKLVCPLNLV